MKKIILTVLCICLSAVFLTVGMYFYARGNDFLKNLTIQAEGEGFPVLWLQSKLSEEGTKETAETDMEKEVSFAAWTELENEYVSGSLEGAGCKTDVIAVYGSSHCLLPFGKNLSIKDTKGCIIGKELAEELFGSHMAEGQELIWRGSTWVIRGVVEEPSGLFMVEAAELAEEIDFDRISIALGRKDDRKLVGEDFISRYGLSANILRWDYLYQAAWLTEMIPGKWSDFDGWKRNIEEHRKMVELVKNTEKTAIEATGLHYQKKGSRLFIAGIILMLCIICDIIHTQNSRWTKEDIMQKENLSATEAMEKLKEGNKRYLTATSNPGDISPQIRRATCDNGQSPYAIVVTCSDSRVIPESIFSAGIGELFIIRVAGNVIDSHQLGSIEYAAGHLGSNLVVVLGHEHCGAVGAAMQGEPHGYIKSITDEIKKAIGDEKDELKACCLNVDRSVSVIKDSLGIKEDDKLKVCGAIYRIDSGEVEFLD